MYKLITYAIEFETLKGINSHWFKTDNSIIKLCNLKEKKVVQCTCVLI